MWKKLSARYGQGLLAALLTAALTLAPVHAADEATAAQATLKVGMHSMIAPFVLPDEQSGLLVDVLRAAFATQGVRAEFLYMPQVRLNLALRDGTVDVSANARPDIAGKAILSHWPVSNFRNMAITLRSHIPAMQAVEELSRWRITAFARARQMLGPAYRAAVERSPNYRETNVMPSAALLLQRTDVIISQRDIFLYYLSQQVPDAPAQMDKLAFHDILGPGNAYWMAFHTAEQRDLFERGVAEIYRNGEIDRIVERYRRKYGTSRDFFVDLDCRFRPPANLKACRN
ncbi:substrate-binding periplasmic protein [Rugamonas sp. CCM 8940]|uniref:substrate-binding periplasmic protein n=1 Tax=Rugamonas sp. CCM 8940 TaxID=2765359 RepID=UPI001F1DB2D7|nr:transporter substrate-binding domain-containing protein [Rugamonas sp. CCM 8940]